MMKRSLFLLLLLLAVPIGLLAQGATWQEATEIKNGETGSCDLKDGQSDAWFKIEVPEEGRALITMTTDGDLSMNWVDLCRIKDDEPDSRTSTGWYPDNGKTIDMTDAGKGTYYLHAQRNSGKGTCSLKYEYTTCPRANDQEPNDTEGTGATLVSGETVEGRLGYTDDTGYRDDNDCYKIEVTEDGIVELAFECDKTYDLNLNWMDFYYYDATNDNYHSRKSTGWYPPQDGTLTITDVAPGTYYVHMQRNGGHGGYTLKYTFIPNSYGNDTEPNDNTGQGDEIAVGATMQGHLGYTDGNNYRDDNDCYKIVAPQDGKVELVYKCEDTNGLSLNWIDFCYYNAQNDDYPTYASTGWYPRENDTLRVNGVGQGTYYIKMQRNGGHGGYTLQYLFTPNNYPNDEEPNNEQDQTAQTIQNDGRVTGHLGYRDGNDVTDKDDWFKLDTSHAGVMLTVTIEPDSTSTLSFNWIDIVRVKDGNSNSVASSGWYPKTPVTLITKEVEEDAEYYLHLQRNSGHGGYTISYGSPQRYEGSEIRITYLGRSTTRLGIPSPYDVKVENIGSGHTGSFYIAIPATPDIEFLSATIPTESGPMEVGREDFAIYDEKEGDCAVFVMNDLAPYQSYTFTVNMQGRAENASTRAGNPEDAFPLKQKGQSVLAALKSAWTEFVDNIEVEAVLEDGITVAAVDAFNDAFTFPEESRQQYTQIIGEVPSQWKQSYREPVAHPVLHYTTKVAENLNPVMAGWNVLRASGKIANSLVNSLRRRIWLWIYKDLGYIKDDPQVMDGSQGTDGIVSSWDPNEMVGPLGYGDEHYIAETKTMDYRICFENKAEATDNAYRIRISDVLDENVFDVSTVRFTGTSHEGPAYNWKVSRDGNKLSWDIEGIELPPNVNAPEGEGYVSFSVDLKPGLKSGTKIKNKAAIIFDSNETIETNEYVNTLDLVAPTTQMVGINAGNDGKSTVTCTGSDEGSGVSHYLFYISADGADYKYLGQSKDPTFTFNTLPSNDCSVIALAVDQVGNTQVTPPEPLTLTPTGISTIVRTPVTGWAIYSLNGNKVASGNGTPTKQLPAGIYIIRQGSDVRKVIIR